LGRAISAIECSLSVIVPGFLELGRGRENG
jgi:hypothetical protein